jgi:hypothetical protein
MMNLRFDSFTLDACEKEFSSGCRRVAGNFRGSVSSAFACMHVYVWATCTRF